MSECETVGEQSQLIPPWAEPKYTETKTAISNISKSIIKANRAVINLENHKISGTFPYSLSVNVKVQVDKSHQPTMDETLAAATVVFQKTLLDALIEVRKKERTDRNKDLQDVKNKFLLYFADQLSDLATIGIYPTPASECKAWVELIGTHLTEKSEAIGRALQTDEHFAAKKKREEVEARNAAREEERLNQTLLDPAVKELQAKVSSLEEKLKKSTASSSSTKKAEQPKAKQATGKKGKQNPKGKGPPQRKAGGGPNNQGQGSGTRKQKPRSTPSIARSGSKKKN